MKSKNYERLTGGLRNGWPKEPISANVPIPEDSNVTSILRGFAVFLIIFQTMLEYD